MEQMFSKRSGSAKHSSRRGGGEEEQGRCVCYNGICTHARTDLRSPREGMLKPQGEQPRARQRLELCSLNGSHGSEGQECPSSPLVSLSCCGTVPENLSRGWERESRPYAGPHAGLLGPTPRPPSVAEADGPPCWCGWSRPRSGHLPHMLCASVFILCSHSGPRRFYTFYTSLHFTAEKNEPP